MIFRSIFFSCIFLFGFLHALSTPLAQPKGKNGSGDNFENKGRWDSTIVFYRNQLGLIPQNNKDQKVHSRLKLIQSFIHLNERDSVKAHIKSIDDLLNEYGDTLSINYFRSKLLHTRYLIKWSYLNLAKEEQQICSGLFSASKNLTPSDSILYFFNIGTLSVKNGDYSEGFKYFDQAKKICGNYLENEIIQLISILNEEGIAYLNQREYFKAEERLEKAKLLTNQFPEIWEYNWVGTFKNLGYVYNMQIKYKKAFSLYQRVQEIYSKFPPPSRQLGDLYYRMAVLKRLEDNPDLTIEYFHQAIPLMGDDSIAVGMIYHNIALAYFSKKNTNKALDYLHKSIRVYRNKNKTPVSTIAKAYMNLGRVYTELENWDHAKRNLSYSISLYESIANKNKTLLILPLYFLGEYYEKQKRFKNAKQTYNYTLTIALGAYGKKHRWTAQAYSKIANLELSRKKFNLALESIQLAINCVFPEDSLLNYQQNPALRKNIAEDELFSLLKLKADILYKKSKSENNLPDLQISLETYLLAQQWADTVRLKINSERDKLNYLNKIHGFYPAALEVCWELFQQTGNKQYLDKAFYLVEKSKANLMMENLQEGEALKFAGIGEDLLEEERNLRARLDKLDNDIYDKERSVENEQDSSLQILRNEAFQLRQQYDSLKTYLVEQHPAYYKLKYDLKVRSIKETQQRLLKPDQAIVEYFVADDYVYIFYISPNTVVFKRVENAAGLVEQVEELRTGLFGWEKTPKSQREDSFMENHKAMYSNAAYKLYQQLLGPIAEEVVLPKKMIIVPDGVLGYIPFDILLKDSIEISTPYTEYPYLIKNHQFAYCYSTTMLSEMKAIQHEKVRKEMLGIAMSFPVGYLTYDENQSRNQNEESEDLSYLRYTKPELKEIQKLVHGLSLIDSKATKEKVLKLIEQYRILHFSTHGILNDEESNLSYLALAGANRVADTGRLYVRDLYNLRLGASMVVLSACETGLGKIRKGEGIISMSRGFSYAGAKSILTTLWQVNDKSTSEIMVAFYQYLKEGKQKDEALRLAKLDYMKNVHAQSVAHPFYWAASVPIGDMSEMEFTDRSWLNYVLAVAIILVLGLGAWYWRRASA